MASSEFSVFDITWPIEGGEILVCDDVDGDGISIIVTARDGAIQHRATLTPTDVQRLMRAIRFLEETRGE